MNQKSFLCSAFVRKNQRPKRDGMAAGVQASVPMLSSGPIPTVLVGPFTRSKKLLMRFIFMTLMYLSSKSHSNIETIKCLHQSLDTKHIDIPLKVLTLKAQMSSAIRRY